MVEAFTLWSLIFVATFSLLSCSRTGINSSKIEMQLRSLLELSTTDYVYRQIGYLGEQRSFLFFQTMNKRLLYRVDIHVRAGVDLRDGFTVASGTHKTALVSMPAAKILQVDADESSLHQYFQRSEGGTVSWLEYGDQIASMEKQTEEDAIERGILTRAEESARGIVSAFLTSAGFSNVTFEESGAR